MQYLALIYAARDAGPAHGTPEWGKMMQDYIDLTAALKAEGHFLAGDALKPVETATSVRLRSGRVETMDGPFAETKEHLGGYYLLEASDLDEAIRIAARIPSAAFGTIELRPVIA